MILRDALDIRRGTAQRNKIYKGTYKVWDRNKIALEGYCKQNTTKGKNLLDYITNLIASGYGLENTINEDGSITTTGIPLDGYRPIVKITDITDFLEDGEIYSISQLNPDPSLYIQVRIVDKENHGTYLSCATSQSKSFTVDKTNNSSYWIMVQTGSLATWGEESKSITNFYQLEKGTATEFEKYTGGQPSPNPDYPQEIEVMQGRQVVNIKNNNYCFTKASDWKIGQYSTEGTIDDTSGLGLKRIRLKDLIPVPQDTQLYFDTFLNPYQLVIRGYDNNKNFVGSYGAVPNKTILNTSGRGIKYLGVSMFNSSGEETTGQTILDKIQSGEIKPFICLNSEEDKSFKPYKNEQYTVDLKSKNIAYNVTYFSQKNRFYPLVRATYEVNEGHYYAISVDTSTTGLLCYLNLLPETLFERVSGNYNDLLDGTRKTWIVKALSTGIAQNVSIISRQTATDDTETGLLSNFMIEEIENPSDTSTDYEPYYDYKLAGIGDYKDNFYTDKGKWYKHETVYKERIISDKVSYHNEYQGIYQYRITTSKGVKYVNDTEIYTKSNYFKGSSQSEWWTKDNSITVDFGTIFITTSKYSDIASFNEFIDNNEVYMYYALTTPTIEEITAPTLINQLNALYQAM